MAVNWNEYELVLEAESSKECEVTGRDIILQPKVGKTKKTLLDYNVKAGDTLEVISDPIAG